MSTLGSTLRAELVGAGGVVERNYYLTEALHLVGLRLVHLDRREHAHDRLHRQGDRGQGGELDVNRVATSLLIGAVVWAYLGVSSSS